MGTRSRLLLLTSAGLLLLILIAGGAGLMVLERIRTGETALRARDIERTSALERMLAGVYLSNALAADYFADPAAAPLLDRIRELEADTKQILARTEAGSLRGEVLDYWKVLNLMIEMAGRRTPGVDAYFRAQLRQRRETMLRISGAAAAAMDRDRTTREAEIGAMYRQFRGLLAGAVLVIVALGSAAAVLATRRLALLEGETRALSAQLLQAQEQERRAVARELHDEIGQSLSGLLLDLGSTASAAGPGPVRTRLEAVSETAARVIEELRRIALSLRPSMLDDLGLTQALEWQAREVGRRSGLSVEVDAAESAGQLPEAHRTCIYRVTQEALQNCVRHAAATHVRIGLQRTDGSVSVRVEDDGKGFAASRTRGLGLIGMQERVLQLGGRLRVLSEPGRGTVITADLPV